MYNQCGGPDRGRGYPPQTLEMWENHPGKPPIKSRIKPDPISGCYKLHVRSIPPTWSESTLRQVFLEVGFPTSVYINTTGNFPLNWGFVEYKTFEEASEAVRTLNEKIAFDGIEVAFAREKVTDEGSLLNQLDYDTFEFLNKHNTPIARNKPAPHPLFEKDSSSSVIKMYSKTIKNDNALGTKLHLTLCCKIPDNHEEITMIENAIFNRILSIYQSLEGFVNCEVCGKYTNQTCECCVVHYCSTSCQAKHWSTHSKTCTLPSRSISQAEVGVGVEARPKTNGMKNGFGSEEFNRNSRSRETLFNDNRFEEKQQYDNRRNTNNDHQNRFNNKRHSRFNDAHNEQETSTRDARNSRGPMDRSPSLRNNKNDLGGSKNQFEDRKSRYLSDKPSKSQAEHENSCDVIEPKTDKNPSEKENQLASNLKESSYQETTQTAASAFSKLLPADVFTEVCVRYKSSEWLAVTPVNKVAELKEFSARLQAEAAIAAPITPAITKCLVLCPVSNRWCRGRVVKVEPLFVKFVDIGATQACNPSNLRELSSDLASVAPFVVFIKPNSGSIEELKEKQTLSVKPIYKEKSGCWVVEIDLTKEKEELVTTTTCVTTTPTMTRQLPQKEEALVTSTPTVTSQLPQQVKADFLDKDCFTPVYITVLHENNNVDGDTYFVAKCIRTMAEFSEKLLDVPKNVMDSPQIGDIGLTLYSGDWYRVKVVCLTPLRVFYLDYGNTETLHSTKELFICPDSFRDLSPLVFKVKLAPGTNKKYFNLKEMEQINVKPVSMLPNETVEVHIEGEDYSESTNSVGVTPVQEVEPPQSTVVNENTEPKSIVDLLEEGYVVNFVPNTIDLAREILYGQLFSKMIPETAKLAVDEEYEGLLNKEPSDPNFTPKEGEIVLCEIKGEWQRAKVLEIQGQKWFSLVDTGMIVQHSACKRLPHVFSNIPLMAVVLKLSTSFALDKLKIIQAEADMEFKVIKGETTKCHLQGHVADCNIEAIVEKWSYEPLVYPLPLADGDLVSIAKMMKSNIVSVVPADDRVIDQTVHVVCEKITCKVFEVPPKIGDYVVFKDENLFHRARVESIDSMKNDYTVKDIDLWYTTTINLTNMQPMPPSLYNLPCRATPVVLEGVRTLETSAMTDLAQRYIETLVRDDKHLRIERDQEFGLVRLTTVKEGELVNEKLEELLVQQILPDLNGKFMFESLNFEEPPLNEELSLLVTHSDKLYVHNMQSAQKYYNEVHPLLQDYGNSESGLYNPCQNEICLVEYEGDWYRALCLQETNTGISSVLLLDFGNLLNAPTSSIRKIHKDFLIFPVIGIACTVIGLPEDKSPKLRERLNEIFALNSQHQGIFEYEQEGEYYVNMPSVLTMLKVESLVS